MRSNTNSLMMDACITTYFSRGYKYQEIIAIVRIRTGFNLSYRQLKESLKRLGLKRRKPLDYSQIEAAIQSELEGSGINLGCRSMSDRLLSRYGISVGRNTVLSMLRRLDPDGVAARLRHRLMRRVYISKGPNYLLHVDGYDKIKRYGFAIHGAIDGYSRKVMWLKVGRTNNDPKIIATYYLDCLSEIDGVPRCLRMDAGTENKTIANMQKAFRWFHGDVMCKEKSVIIGSSHSNQRIECWWRRLHEMCVAGWQEILGEMESQGIFSTAVDIHKELTRFCFMQIIQSELDLVRQEWNDHYIRRQNNSEIHGKPEILYHYPELNGTRDYKFPIHSGDIAALRQFCNMSTVTGCDEPLQTSLFQFLETTGQAQPETVDQAKDLLQSLITRFSF